MKRKCISWILAYYVTLTFNLTHDLDVGFFKVKFPNSSISGIVGLIDGKWKGSELIRYWAGCVTLPFYHTYDLDLQVSRSECELALSQEWDGRLTWNERDVSHPFMTMILNFVWPWWGGRMYKIVTGVISDIGMLAAYLVNWVLFKQSCNISTILSIMQQKVCQSYSIMLPILIKHHNTQFRNRFCQLLLDM